MPPKARSTRVTAGLKWAPEAGPSARISATSTPAVANGVLEQLEAAVVGEALGHDPGADDAGDQERGPGELGREAPDERRHGRRECDGR